MWQETNMAENETKAQRAVYECTLSSFLSFFGIFVVIGVTLLGVGVVFYLMLRSPGRGVMGEQIACIIVAVLGCLALLALFVCFFRRIKRVIVNERGITWTRGSQTHERMWSDVGEVFREERIVIVNGTSVGKYSHLRVVFADGETLALNKTVVGLKELSNRVQEVALVHQLPEARAQLVGSAVEFGPIQLTQEGLVIDEEVHYWEEIPALRVSGGWLTVITTDEEEKHVALKDIPNYLVLFALLGELGHPPGAPEAGKRAK
jgi:hypothetical protein